MSLHHLRELPLRQQVAALANRRNLLERVWSDETWSARLFAEALVMSREGGSSEQPTARAFLAGLYTLLRRPSEVLALQRALPKKYAAAWLEELVTHPLVSVDLVAALVSTEETAGALPSGGWKGDAIHRRGSMLLADDPTRLFTVAELCPLGVGADRASSRALLGSAFDGGRLAPGEAERLLELFPGDRYLTSKLSPKLPG